MKTVFKKTGAFFYGGPRLEFKFKPKRGDPVLEFRQKKRPHTKNQIQKLRPSAKAQAQKRRPLQNQGLHIWPHKWPALLPASRAAVEADRNCRLLELHFLVNSPRGLVRQQHLELHFFSRFVTLVGGRNAPPLCTCRDCKCLAA